MTALEVRRAGLAAATALSLAFSISPLSTTSVLAQWIVYDPTNFSQNVLTAARELQQINNQIQMLTNQAQSLVNQGKNLANLPLSTLTQLQSSIAKTQSLLSQAQNIAFNVERVQTMYSSTYGTAAATGSNATMFAAAQSRWQNSVGAFEDSLKVQAGVVGNISTNSSAMTNSSRCNPSSYPISSRCSPRRDGRMRWSRRA
jgi:P-type conjugative transfer protein TrbJ